MWERIIELCADMFGVTVHSRLGQLVLFCVAIFVLGVLLAVRWGLGSLGVPLALLFLAVAAARQVAVARDDLWRAACLELDERGQRPASASSRILAPTAASLARLAEAVDLVRRAQYAGASDLVPQIHRDLLRPEEGQLLDAVRAMISSGLGAQSRAARQAVIALPTGSEDLDACLGRTLLADAWNDPTRLLAIHGAWSRAGVEHGPLSRLSNLALLRIDESAIDRLEPPAARDLVDEARAVGDDALAAELDARSRPTAYR